MKPEEMLQYAKKYDISERELNWLKSPYQRIEHVTKFEFQQIFHKRLSIEKSPFSNEDKWVIKDFGMYFYNYYEGKFDIRNNITKENLPNFQRSLKHAFDFVKRLQKKEQERKIFYIGRCEWCDKYIGEENLLEAFGWKICKECSDKID
jgi:formylmethanofuran dehydrogenase subunit E